MRSWPYAALGALLLGAILVPLAARTPGSYGEMNAADTHRYVLCAAVAGAAYAGGVWLIRNRPAPRHALTLILAAGLLARLAVLAAPPLLSTDIYRYVWDGRVQAAGINPYRYLPIDPALAPLRDHPPYAGEPHRATDIFPNINRVDTAPTIYPPVAQALFLLVGLTVPSIWTMKAAMLGLDLLTAVFALLLLRAAARPAAQILVWAWNPLVIWEYAGAGHVDALAMAFIALALLLATQARQGWAGLALGAAIASKLLPAVLFPAIWRRWDLRSPIAAAALILAGYAVYASVGLKVFGYLSGYTQEENLQDGAGFLALRVLQLAGPLPGWAGKAYAVAGLGLLAAAALWIVRRPLPATPAARAPVIARGALVMAGTLLAVMSPHYPWYLTMLVLPAVLVPSWAALWPTIAAPLLYMDLYHEDLLAPLLILLPAFALLLIDFRFPPRPILLPRLAKRGS